MDGARGAAAAVAGSLLPGPGVAQLPQQAAPDLEKGDIAVALDRTAYLAGEPAQLAVRLTIEDGWHTNSYEPTYDYLIATEIDVEAPPDWPAPETPRYPPGEMKRFDFAPTAISVYEGEIFIRTVLPTAAGAAAGTYPIRTNVTYQACDDKMCLAPVTTPATVGLTIAAGGEVANSEFFAAAASGTGGQGSQLGGAGRGFLWFVLLGFLGGLILNAMPCVLPVLSLKVFGLLKSAEGGQACPHDGEPRDGSRDHPLLPASGGGGDRRARGRCRGGLGDPVPGAAVRRGARRP